MNVSWKEDPWNFVRVSTFLIILDISFDNMSKMVIPKSSW